MKWLIELAKDKELPKMARVMVMITYCLWAVGTIVAIFGWAWSFLNGGSTLTELLNVLGKCFGF